MLQDTVTHWNWRFCNAGDYNLMLIDTFLEQPVSASVFDSSSAQ